MTLDAVDRSDQLLDLAKGHIPANRSSAALVARMMTLALKPMNSAYPAMLGLSGSQGSGKSTLSALLKLGLEQLEGKRVAILALDDFYLPRAERLNLAAQVHPLCITRGVPGTHDIPAMLTTISRLLMARSGDTTRWPRFDKLRDDRADKADWFELTGRPDLIIVEGWCVGLTADRIPSWTGPINALELADDPDGVWISWAQQQLRDHYAVLWKMMDVMVGIRLPDIETVIASRLLQEQEMLAHKGPGATGMSEAEIARFVQHYERFTRALWASLPDFADIIADRDGDFAYREVALHPIQNP